MYSSMYRRDYCVAQTRPTLILSPPPPNAGIKGVHTLLSPQRARVSITRIQPFAFGPLQVFPIFLLSWVLLSHDIGNLILYFFSLLILDSISHKML